MRKPLLLASLVTTLACCVSTSRAEVVSTILTLDASSPTTNSLTLSLLDGDDNVLGVSDAPTEFSGTLNLDLEINRVTGEVDWINFTGGDVVGTPWTISTLGIASTASTAVGDTIPDGPNFGQVNGTSFNAEEHALLLTGGQVTPGPVLLDGTEIQGTGLGTLTTNITNGEIEIVFAMNMDDREPLAPGQLSIVGSVLARGSVTAIPEPASAACLALLFAGAALRRRR